MALLTLRCAIEDVVDWHPHLFLEPHVVACVAVMSHYSPPPALFDVECSGIESDWLGGAERFKLELSWSALTRLKAERLRVTVQRKPLLEIAAVSIGLLLVHRVIDLGKLDVTEYGDRADYRSLSVPSVLEISGTEKLSDLQRRHRAKVAQALANPFGWSSYVVVCAFSSAGHRIKFSHHSATEVADG